MKQLTIKDAIIGLLAMWLINLPIMLILDLPVGRATVMLLMFVISIKAVKWCGERIEGN